MALDKLVDSTQLDTDLTSVANAIRTKGGTSAQLAFPNDFISAIQNLGGDGLTNEVKQALLQIGQKVAYIDDQGQQYYNDLMAALYPVDSISAVFTQGGAVIYDTDSLDTLRQYLVVTANYTDGTSSVVTTYTLSGTLEEGTSTITVSYGGEIDTFDVTVTERQTYFYSITNGNLIKMNGASGRGGPTGISIGINSGALARRREFPIEEENGNPPFYQTTDDQNYTVTNPPVYPIPIPNDATGVTVTITPNTQYVAGHFFTLANSVYSYVKERAWTEGGFSESFEAGSLQYLNVFSKYNSSGTSYPTEPTNVTVEFTTE